MNRVFLAILFLGTAFSACKEKKAAPADTNNSNIAEVYSEDGEMNQAIAKAKSTFNKFDTAFKNNHYDHEGFSLKVRFRTEQGGEHIWADNITFTNGAYYGIVDEDAVAAKGVKAGDTVRITTDNLSDWMYDDNGVMRGGYTIRVLRNRFSEAERASFDSSFHLRITDQQ